LQVTSELTKSLKAIWMKKSKISCSRDVLHFYEPAKFQSQ